MKSLLKVVVLAVGLTAVATPALARGPGPFVAPWRGVAAALHFGRAIVAPGPVPAAVVAAPGPAPRWIPARAPRVVAPWVRPVP